MKVVGNFYQWGGGIGRATCDAIAKERLGFFPPRVEFGGGGFCGSCSPFSRQDSILVCALSFFFFVAGKFPKVVWGFPFWWDW